MTNKINGIDVSEEIRYCNNCSNLGLDFETGKFYCSLSNRKDELPEILSCENFSSNCYINRLQEENKELEKKKDEYYLINLDYEAKISYLIQALEEIRKEYTNSIFYQCNKTEEECPCHNCIILGQLDRVQNIIKIIDEVINESNI